MECTLINSNNEEFIHRCVLYASDYHLLRMSKSKHWFIDFIYIFPANYCQMFVIVNKDILTEKCVPGFYGLLNSKFEVAYKDMLNRL